MRSASGMALSPLVPPLSYDNGLVGQNRRAADDSIEGMGFILHADFANWLCELRARTILFIISSNLVRMPGIGR
jgi:hypothetical protein